MTRRLLLPVALCILFAIPAQADPIEYRIDYITLTGVGTLDPTFFTYDPATELFTGFYVFWRVPFYPGGIAFPFTGSLAAYFDINNFESFEKQEFLSLILAGGDWWAADAAMGDDIFFSMANRLFGIPGAGFSTGTSASGTFTARPVVPAAVPELGTLTLLSIALMLGLVYSARRRAIDKYGKMKIEQHE